MGITPRNPSTDIKLAHLDLRSSGTEWFSKTIQLSIKPYAIFAEVSIPNVEHGTNGIVLFNFVIEQCFPTTNKKLLL